MFTRDRIKCIWRGGFTLIEIMLVICIIGILTAIAIPNFFYFMRSASNSSAISDLKNVMSWQELMATTYQSYGVSSGPIPLVAGSPAYPGSGGGVGSLLNNSLVGAGNTIGLTSTDATFGNVGVTIALSQNVSLIASTEVPVAPGVSGLSSYTIMVKHLRGHTYYGKSSNSNVIYMDKVNGSDGTFLAITDAVPSTIGNDDFAPPTLGPSGNNWTIK